MQRLDPHEPALEPLERAARRRGSHTRRPSRRSEDRSVSAARICRRQPRWAARLPGSKMRPGSRVAAAAVAPAVAVSAPADGGGRRRRHRAQPLQVATTMARWLTSSRRRTARARLGRRSARRPPSRSSEPAASETRPSRRLTLATTRKAQPDVRTATHRAAGTPVETSASARNAPPRTAAGVASQRQKRRPALAEGRNSPRRAYASHRRAARRDVPPPVAPARLEPLTEPCRLRRRLGRGCRRGGHRHRRNAATLGHGSGDAALGPSSGRPQPPLRRASGARHARAATRARTAGSTPRPQRASGPASIGVPWRARSRPVGADRVARRCEVRVSGAHGASGVLRHRALDPEGGWRTAERAAAVALRFAGTRRATGSSPGRRCGSSAAVKLASR